MNLRGRVCDRCGVKMPFGVSRRRVDDKLVCDGCINDRPGMPRSQVIRQGVQVDQMSLVRKAVLTKQAEFPPKKKSDDGGDSAPPSHGAPPPPHHDPAGPPAGPHMMQQGMGPNMDPMGMGQPQAQQGQMQQFAPDQKSDLIVRVCPFCGSGHLIGRSDGSIECGYDNNVFTVTVMPSHPFQPLVNPDGSPFSMPQDPNADPHPQIGTADPASTPGEGPADLLAGDTPEGQAPTEMAQARDSDTPIVGAPSAPGAPEAPQPGASGATPLDVTFEKVMAEVEGKAPGAPEDAKAVPDSGSQPKPDDKDDKDDKDGKNQPPWMKKKTYRTTKGAELTEDAYVAHLRRMLPGL